MIWTECGFIFGPPYYNVAQHTPILMDQHLLADNPDIDIGRAHIYYTLWYENIRETFENV